MALWLERHAHCKAHGTWRLGNIADLPSAIPWMKEQLCGLSSSHISRIWKHPLCRAPTTLTVDPAMEVSYGIGVTNRYALFYDENEDPLDAIKSAEKEQSSAAATKKAAAAQEPKADAKKADLKGGKAASAPAATAAAAAPAKKSGPKETAQPKAVEQNRPPREGIPAPRFDLVWRQRAHHVVSHALAYLVRPSHPCKNKFLICVLLITSNYSCEESAPCLSPRCRTRSYSGLLSGLGRMIQIVLRLKFR